MIPRIIQGSIFGDFLPRGVLHDARTCQEAVEAGNVHDRSTAHDPWAVSADGFKGSLLTHHVAHLAYAMQRTLDVDSVKVVELL